MRQLLGRSIAAAAIAAVVFLGDSIERIGSRLVAQSSGAGESMPGPIVEEPPPGPYRGNYYVPAVASVSPIDGQPGVVLTDAQSVFQITFDESCSGCVTWPAAAKTALQAAADVWASQLQSSVTIRARVGYLALTSQTTLGQAGATTLSRNFANAPIANTWYPIALANAKAGSHLNGEGATTYEITGSFNTFYDCDTKAPPCWYFGTDGNPGAKIDFMAVAMHELGHGLGFFGSLRESSSGSGLIIWGGNTTPATTNTKYVYDHFAVNGSNLSVLDASFGAGDGSTPSAALFALLTGDVVSGASSVFFSGANAKAANGNANVPLHAPATFSSGSTYNHLRESSFPAGTAHSLMTPQLGAGESIHDPGSITRGMFTDMGWGVSTAPAPTFTSITPTSWSTAGGGAFTITGTGFISGATVKFGGSSGTLATSVVIASATTITGVIPARSAGVVSVVVTNTDNQAATLTNGFTYVTPTATPTLTSVTPASGPVGGGTNITLGGTNFQNGATVKLGGTSATNVVVVNATTITARTAGRGAGLVNAVVQNPDGQTATRNNAFTYLAPITNDFDGDRKSDLTIYRPSSGVWYVLKSSNNYDTAAAGSYAFGQSGDQPLGGDFDGDGKTDITVYRPSNGYWFTLTSSSNFTTYTSFQWGASSDVPVLGDFDGDGKTDIAVWRPSNGYWFILKSSTNYTQYDAIQWGISTDTPLVGDFDGDGRSDIVVYRPTTGVWYILKSSSNFTLNDTVTFGLAGDQPLIGEFDGDGKTDITAYRASGGVWFVLKSSTNYASYDFYQWGIPSDVPVVRDFDGDGRTDVTALRPSVGIWYTLLSSFSYNPANFIYRQWGLPTDILLP